MTTYLVILQSIASLTGIATSTSLIIAYRQLRLATRNSQGTFEDALVREHRQVAHRVPLRALLGEALPDEEVAAKLADFYWYFDLTNQQVFLRRHGRVTDLTWRSWSEGIRHVMSRPAFARAWEMLRPALAGSLGDLRRFADGGFDDDPAGWGARRQRAPAAASSRALGALGRWSARATIRRSRARRSPA